jgi:ABC-type Fe3+ transport system substrate-binding protein
MRCSGSESLVRPSRGTILPTRGWWVELALADPTKSGSVAKAFENILQREMQAAVRRAAAAAPADLASTGEARAVAAGWVAGLQLIQRIGANARYFSDTSQEIPIDVAAGNCAAGVCIDFYGRQQEEAVRRRSAANRLGYVAPEGGTVASVDPIALLRGAPHRAAATAFIEYTLSLEGQKLWNFRPGTPGGPERLCCVACRCAAISMPARSGSSTAPIPSLRSSSETL